MDDPTQFINLLGFETKNQNMSNFQADVTSESSLKKAIFCHIAQNSGLLQHSWKYFTLCKSIRNHSISYESSVNESDSLQERILATSWTHFVIILLLVGAAISNYTLYRKERLVQRRNKGARLLYLSSIIFDVMYCAQAVFYSSVVFTRSIIRKDPSLNEECFLMTLNAFSLKLVFSSNLVMVITRFLAIFFPFWFVVKINLQSAKKVIIIFFLIASVESFIVIGYCIFDAVEMLSNLYWAVSTVSVIFFIVLCNACLLIFSHYMFRRQRRKIYKRNGTYRMYRNLTQTKAAIQSIGVLAISVAGIQSENIIQLASPQRQHVKIHCFKEHENKKRVKKLLLLTSLSYLVMVLPHFTVQILSHFQLFGKTVDWKWAWRCSLLLLQLRFLINPCLYLFNRMRVKRIESKKQAITRKFSVTRV